MRTAIFLSLMTLSAISRSSECEPWTAHIEFKIEGASYSETVTWVAGWVEAIKNINGSSNELHVCIPKCAYEVSKEIVEILNAKFEGQTISAETAAAAIWPTLRGRLACSRVDEAK